MASFEMIFGYPKEAEQAKKERWPILIPVGTMEYHSTHCPFGCDGLVAKGIADKIAERIDCVVYPPIWYGVASYAVAGPEKNTVHVDCDTFEAYVYCILKSLFAAGFNRNIYFVIAHQTEDYNPTELACMKAARKLIFEYLEETIGTGWWGDNKNKAFYETMTGGDNPWNWVRVIAGGAARPVGVPSINIGDHAGKYECSDLEYLFPGSIKLDRLKDSDDWFAETAVEMSAEQGKERVERAMEFYIKMITGQEEK